MTWKDRSRKTTWTVAILIILVVIFASSTTFFYIETLNLKAALVDLITSIIQKSSCPMLKQFENSATTMETFGDLVNQTEKEKGCN